jgi:hypothetical protein
MGKRLHQSLKPAKPNDTLNKVNVIIKQHDTKCKFTDVLKVGGVPVDLTGSTVSFLLRSVGGIGIKQAATVPTPASGAVEYTPVASDVAAAGEFRQEWEVVDSGGKILTFPNGSYNTVRILPDLA